MERKAPVCNVIPFSYVDGPGNRTSVFFQGCGFRCTYCHNPESISLCNNCGACVPQCPVNALYMQDGEVHWNAELCCGCDKCIQVCPNSSNPRIRMLTAAQIWQECLPQLPFIQGITVSGGECTQQHLLLPELFDLAHKAGKTAFVDTNGQTLFCDMPQLTQAMDMAMLDVKSADEEEHKALTGQSCANVLKNLVYLAQHKKLYEVRTVVVPGQRFTDTVDKVSRILADYPEVNYKLIRFRNWGVRGALQDMQSPPTQTMEELQKLAKANGVQKIEVV
ncbi:MAG: YjjW family glycine radical enzyme activase [Oscillospiraceae bacterium]